MMNKHGDIVTEGDMGYHARWCDTHGYHGPLHVCPDYPEEARKSINDARLRFAKNLHNPEWQALQRAKGVPRVVIDMYKDAVKKELQMSLEDFSDKFISPAVISMMTQEEINEQVRGSNGQSRDADT